MSDDTPVPIPAVPILVIGCSDGIGLAAVKMLLDRNEEVIGVSRSAVEIEHPRYRHFVLDVTSPEYPELLQLILAEQPDLRTVVHCAGVGSGFDPRDFSGELACFRTNLHSVAETAAAFVPAWIQGGRGGHLVALSSLADHLIISDSPSYSASKAGLSSYLRGLGLALRVEGIAITNVRFGFVDTKMGKAKVRPFLITAERAARVVLRSLETRVPVVSYPWAASWGSAAVHSFQGIALRIGGLVRRGPPRGG